jgi:hypothetical protein
MSVFAQELEDSRQVDSGFNVFITDGLLFLYNYSIIFNGF